MIWLAMWLGCSHGGDGPKGDGAADADTDVDSDADTDADGDADTDATVPKTGTLTVDWSIGGQQGSKTCEYGDADYFPSWPSLGTIWSLDCTAAPDFGFYATHQPDPTYSYTVDDVHLSLSDPSLGIDTSALAIAQQVVAVDAVDSTIPHLEGSFSVSYSDGSTLSGAFDTDVLP